MIGDLMRDGATWTAGGYGAPATVDAVVYLPGAFYVAGRSPSLKTGGKDYLLLFLQAKSVAEKVGS